LERRRYRRLPLHVPVEFEWRDAAGVQQRGQGFSKDLSASGILVLCPSGPPPGAELVIEVELPSPDGDQAGWRITAPGSVIRRAQVEEGAAFAVAATLAPASMP
jgi:hypothetical protein